MLSAWAKGAATDPVSWGLPEISAKNEIPKNDPSNNKKPWIIQWSYYILLSIAINPELHINNHQWLYIKNCQPNQPSGLSDNFHQSQHHPSIPRINSDKAMAINVEPSHAKSLIFQPWNVFAGNLLPWPPVNHDISWHMKGLRMGAIIWMIWYIKVNPWKRLQTSSNLILPG